MFFVSRMMTVFLLCPLFVGLYLRKKKKLNERTVCALILITGLILRVIYIIYTSVHERQHDVHDFFESDAGHAEYIEFFLNFNSLPDFDPRLNTRTLSQFYHPPLHHIICGLWLRLMRFLGIPLETVGVESLQVLTAAYSFLFTLFAYKAFKLLEIKPAAIMYCTAFVTFHPTLIILSGSINNDMLSSLFGITAVYYTLRWAKKRDWLSIVLTALSVGLGMFTKLSVGLLAPAAAIVFLYVFIKNLKDFKKLIPQFAVFGLICIPIGLFWPVRNYIKFGVPINYVPKLSEESGQFIDKSFFRRIFDWSLYQFSSPFTQWEWYGAKYNEFNPTIALMKNAMFDEETFFKGCITLQGFCTALFFSEIVTAVILLIAFFSMWFNNKKVKLEHKLLITFIAAVFFGSYIIFCKNYPQVCTENMRYCVPLIFAAAALMGVYVDEEPNGKMKNFHSLAVRIGKKNTVVFCILSTFVYTAEMFYETAP